MQETALINPTAPVITHPKAQKIDVAKALKLRLQGNTLEEIGKVFGVTRSAVHDSLQKFEAFTGFAKPGVLTAYSEHRAELFNVVEAHLTASLLDGDALAKASLNNRAYAFKQIHEARRLEMGQSTSNQALSLLGQIVLKAEERLGVSSALPQAAAQAETGLEKSQAEPTTHINNNKDLP
jgi:predicted DNA-binding protein YlxM (UPF0122 family)